MRDFFGIKAKHLVILVLIMAIGIPVIIYALFRMPAPFSFLIADGIWTAGDILGYYGVLLGAFGAFIGVSWTIRQGRQQFKEETEAKIRPYFILSDYDRDIRIDFFTGNSTKEKSEGTHYTEFIRDRYYLIIENGETKIRGKINEKQEELIKSGGLCMIEENYASGLLKRSLVFNHIISQVFEIENVGAGAADLFMVEFYSANSKPTGVCVKLPSFKVGQRCTFHLFSEDDSKVLEGDYNLDFTYSDIYGNEYLQRYVFQMELDQDEKLRLYRTSENQERIERR